MVGGLCGWVLMLGQLGEIRALAVRETRWAVYYTHICLVYIVTPVSEQPVVFA